MASVTALAIVLARLILARSIATGGRGASRCRITRLARLPDKYISDTPLWKQVVVVSARDDD